MEKRNPTQSPLPPLIDFLQIYTIHEYIYIYTCMYMLFIFSATLLGVLWPAQTMTPVAANRNRSWNTETQKEQAKRRLKPAAFFIVKAEARGPKRECYAPSRTMRACVRVYPTDTYTDTGTFTSASAWSVELGKLNQLAQGDARRHRRRCVYLTDTLNLGLVEQPEPSI